MPKNATLTIGPNEKNKEKNQDTDGETKRETKHTENIHIGNRKGGKETTTKTTHNNKRENENSDRKTGIYHSEKTIISIEKGLRTLNIASLNPDSMREKEMQHEIVKGIAKNKNPPIGNTGNAHNERL